jgi:hypothetical protein
MQIFNCEQGSPEWFECRRGIPTASEFKTIIGVKKDASDKKTRQKYMRRLAGETIAGRMDEPYTNAHMERGKVMEDEARRQYAFECDVEPEKVGFIRDGDAGCSPDSLVGKNGGLEIKTALLDIQVDRLESGALPSEFKFQVHGNIWIADREWWDFVSYSPGLPLFKIRVYRDEGIISDLKRAVDAFNIELRGLIEKIRRYGEARAA